MYLWPFITSYIYIYISPSPTVSAGLHLPIGPCLPLLAWRDRKQAQFTLTACIRLNYGNGMQSSAWCHLTRQKHLNTPSISLSGKRRGHLGWVGLWVFWQEQSRRNLVTLQRLQPVCSIQRQATCLLRAARTDGSLHIHSVTSERSLGRTGRKLTSTHYFCFFCCHALSHLTVGECG